MKIQYDFKKDWPQVKKKLIEISHEAMELAKKGEERLVKFSHEGKLRLDAGSLSLKKEQLFYLIGKEYVKSGTPGEKSTTMDKLLKELKAVNAKQKALDKQIKKAAGKTAKSSSQKTKKK